MPNSLPAEKQVEALKPIWQQYRAYAKTSRRLKFEQGSWRTILIVATVLALFATPFAKGLEREGLSGAAKALVVVATVLFALVAWLNKEVLGDDSQQAWVRARQIGEGLKSLAFRFLGGISPYDGADSARIALDRAAELVAKTGVAADPVDGNERTEKIPSAPLSAADYVDRRLDDQIAFYRRAAERESKLGKRISNMGRLVSLGIIVFGALGAVIAQEWRDIWAPAFGIVGAMVTTQMTRARHEFLVESYSTTAVKLEFTKAAWNISDHTQNDLDRLVTGVEANLADENAAWVQQMLIRPAPPEAASTAQDARR